MPRQRDFREEVGTSVKQIPIPSAKAVQDTMSAHPSGVRSVSYYDWLEASLPTIVVPGISFWNTANAQVPRQNGLPGHYQHVFARTPVSLTLTRMRLEMQLTLLSRFFVLCSPATPISTQKRWMWSQIETIFAKSFESLVKRTSNRFGLILSWREVLCCLLVGRGIPKSISPSSEDLGTNLKRHSRRKG